MLINCVINCFIFRPQGYRETQRALVDMTDKTADVDRIKGETLEDISSMVEQIGREFKNKQTQLQPLIAEVKVSCIRQRYLSIKQLTCLNLFAIKNVRQEHMDVESQYQERKNTYDKVAVGLEMEKQGLEKDCNQFQVRRRFKIYSAVEAVCD